MRCVRCRYAGRRPGRVHGRHPAVQDTGLKRCSGFPSGKECVMKYRIRQIPCRPWTLNGLSLKLIESHYENNYGGALRRLNAISEQLESLDFAAAPAHVLNGL